MAIFHFIVVMVLGLIGSFLVNYIGDVFPRAEEKQNLKEYLSPVCGLCKEKISWRSFLFFKPCNLCGQNKSKRFWLVLLIVPVLFILEYYFPPQGVSGEWMASLVLYFSAVAVIDIEERSILRSLTIFGWLLTFLIGILSHKLSLTLLGGASGLIIMLGLYYAGVFFKKIMEKQKGIEMDEALGFGDVYIAVMAGFVLAFPNVIYGLLMAILMGGLTSLVYLFYMLVKKEYKPFSPIPYAPFIMLSVILILYRPIY